MFGCFFIQCNVKIRRQKVSDKMSKIMINLSINKFLRWTFTQRFQQVTKKILTHLEIIYHAWSVQWQQGNSTCLHVNKLKMHNQVSWVQTIGGYRGGEVAGGGGGLQADVSRIPLRPKQANSLYFIVLCYADGNKPSWETTTKSWFVTFNTNLQPWLLLLLLHSISVCSLIPSQLLSKQHPNSGFSSGYTSGGQVEQNFSPAHLEALVPFQDATVMAQWCRSATRLCCEVAEKKRMVV